MASGSMQKRSRARARRARKVRSSGVTLVASGGKDLWRTALCMIGTWTRAKAQDCERVAHRLERRRSPDWKSGLPPTIPKAFFRG